MRPFSLRDSCQDSVAKEGEVGENYVVSGGWNRILCVPGSCLGGDSIFPEKLFVKSCVSKDVFLVSIGPIRAFL